MKRVTIADIARDAETSTAVVSYVLNPGTRPVSEGLRARVVDAMDRLDYRPDRHARGLRRRTRWGQIGLLVPDLTLPLYAAMAGCIVREGRARSQLVITGSTGFDTAVEAELVQGFADVGVDGLIVMNVEDVETTDRICRAARTPVVWMHNNRGLSQSKCVAADHIRAGALATRHLLEHGRESIAFVGGFTTDDAASGDRATVRQRHEGYVLAVGTHARHLTTDLTLDGAYRAIRAAIADGPRFDALVVGTYGQAAAALKAVTDAGLTVPQDVAVATFDGDARNIYGQIVLTTVQQCIEEMTATALDLLLGVRDRDQPLPPFEVYLSVGDSCGCSTGAAWP
jgi:LacI family transcriptional regulator